MMMRCHYDDVIMTTMASQITSLTVVYSIVYSGVDQRKHQSSVSLAFVRVIPVTRKMLPFDDVIMTTDFTSAHQRIATSNIHFHPKSKWRKYIFLLATRPLVVPSACTCIRLRASIKCYMVISFYPGHEQCPLTHWARVMYICVGN